MTGDGTDGLATLLVLLLRRCLEPRPCVGDFSGGTVIVISTSGSSVLIGKELGVMGTVGDCMELLLRPRLPALDELSDLGLPGPVLFIDGSLLVFFAGDGADSISKSRDGRLSPLSQIG